MRGGVGVAVHGNRRDLIAVLAPFSTRTSLTHECGMRLHANGLEWQVLVLEEWERPLVANQVVVHHRQQQQERPRVSGTIPRTTFSRTFTRLLCRPTHIAICT